MANANTSDMREAFKNFRDQRNKELKANGLNDQSSFWITNSHYTAWCRGIDWGQSQQVQVTEFDKKLFDSECRESVAGALGFQKGGDYAWSYLLAQIKEAVAAADMPPETTAPSALPEGWRVGNLVTMNQDEYPGLGGWFTQIWCGDDVVARIYGEDHEQIRERIDTILTASPAPEHSGDGNEMVGWISVNEQTPSQGERVLLKIDLEDCPVVGYWGCGRYEACTVNMEVSCGAFCYGGNVDGSFSGEDVTHWMPLPNPPQQEEAER